MRVQWMTLVAAALTVNCSTQAPAPVVDKAAEENAIGELATKWIDAAARKDVDTIVSFYAPDGTIVWPDAPAGRGPDAVRAAWTEVFKTPGLKLTFVPERFDLSSAGDMAADFGRIESEFDGPQGTVKDVAKYVVVWRKVNGQWRVLYDTFNSNQPAAPAAQASTPAS